MDLDDIQIKTETYPASFNVPEVHSETASDALNLIDQWYSKISRTSRWMDLIGDYAGNERFVLDGDALVQEVLNDPLMALGRPGDPSFQISHARWSIEKLLKNLLDRSAVFDVVFWEDNRHLSLHTGASRYTLASRNLARQLIYKHICSSNITVHVFGGLADAEWINYCNLKRPMFVMTNDGGLVHSSGSVDMEVERILHQRLFIHDILANGLAVSLLSNIEFRDSKILAFVLEEQRQQKRNITLPKVVYHVRDNAVSSLRSAVMECLPSSPYPSLLRPSTDAQSSSMLLPDYLREFTREFLADPVASSDNCTCWLLSVFLAHFFVVERLSLAQRAQRLPILNRTLLNLLLDNFLPAAFACLADVVASQSWHANIDTRIFICIIFIQTHNPALSLSDVVGAEVLSNVESILHEFTSSSANFRDIVEQFPVLDITHDDRPPSSEPPASVLPFHNEVFNEALSLVRVRVEDESGAGSAHVVSRGFFDYGGQALFTDDRHWHRDKKILPKHLGGENAHSVTAYARKRMLKREQRFMAQMQRHAETLTGAVGAPLRQQVIVSADVGSSKGKKKEKAFRPPQAHGENARKKQVKEKPLTSIEKLRLKNQEDKQKDDDQSSATWWKGMLPELEKIADLSRRSSEASALLTNDRTRRGWLALELRLYIIHVELQKWIAHDESDADAVRDQFSLSIMRMVKDLYDRVHLSETVQKRLETVLKALGFQDYVSCFSSLVSMADELDRKLSFKFTKLVRSSGELVHEFMHITEHPVQWQLRLYGEFVDRSMDSQPDARVSFNPDRWQRKVLDCLDTDKSVLVVAPTSAGKTFISFYAMEKVLRESDDGILVYVAPTKALVNQVAAEVYARFKKELRSGTCWAIHTRDYRINNPQKCQILITVPEMFAIMLLSPPLARSWTPRIKRIILDEIHTIGQQEGGAVWEQILLLAPCPVIGLSATIGQPEVFNQWLSSVQKAHGIKHEFINHPHRYSHLRKFVYVKPEKPSPFRGLDQLSQHEESRNLHFIHPVSTLAFGNPVIPPDFSLEARDTLSLYLSLKRIQSDIPESFDISGLDPIKFFSKRTGYFLKQEDILDYEAKLKECLANLMSLSNSIDERSPLQRVITMLNDPILAVTPSEILNTPPSPQEFLDGLMGLLTDLHSRDSLPALLFSFDRSNCEIMAQTALEALTEAEENWRQGSPDWARKIQQWEKWKRRQDDQQRTQEKSKSKRTTDDDSRDRQEMLLSSWESNFDPGDPLPEFSFAGWKKYTKEELNADIKDLSWTSTPAWALSGLRRGLGVHHSGMNKQYRSLVESLFRMGYLRVLFCTGTLALGINAPTKTTVFCGDSPFLTALTYRQCAGRAGRRGFDLLGNVVFYGLPMDRVQRLILSKLPSLTGSFPLTSTLCLRLLNLLQGFEDSKNSKGCKFPDFAVKAINSITNLPQISFGSYTGKEQLLYHLRFSIDYLRRTGLIDVSGRPMNLYAIAAHLYHTEPSNFALITLMRSGVLHKVCSQSSNEQARRDLMLILCHLFGRRYLHEAYASKKNLQIVRRQYPSLVVLPALPGNVREVLVKHNKEILQIFSAYARLYATQYVTSLGSDDILPLSGLRITQGPAVELEMDRKSTLETFLDSRKINVCTRSLFVANSGHDDTVHSIEELTRTCRRGLQLNGHAIPSLSRIAASPALSGDDDGPKLNAHLYDFYIHGQVNTLVAANGIRRGDVWYVLEDFNLALVTIKTALQQLLLQAGKEFTEDADVDLDDVEPGASYDDVWGNDGDTEIDSGYATEANDTEFPRPPKVSDGDWRVYQVLNDLTNEFRDKFRKMWS